MRVAVCVAPLETAKPADAFDRTVAWLLQQTVNGNVPADDGYRQLGLLALSELGPLVRRLSRGGSPFTAEELWSAFMMRLFMDRLRILHWLQRERLGTSVLHSNALQRRQRSAVRGPKTRCAS